ncbi:hypothetical protein [Acidithiobacillus ferrivorans]|uniref:hypothetical protein n=1 Tax=Acidithiobacillus ferrivorans TaxID=160808 RepID=UPI001C079EB8|nr:hypothetical protein [Acidithiobacillus ferrivorans]MBU2851651.1 hypothetical protein [Acidithiobacillus ferrivorans]
MKETDNASEDFPIVAKIIDKRTVILNKGSINGIVDNQEFCLFSKGEEIFDPITNESLGHIEISRGCGRITQLQTKISVLTAGSTNQLLMTYFQANSQDKKPEFTEAMVGDFAKPKSKV